MAKADIQRVLPVPKDKLYSVITAYEDYPKFVDGCTSVKVDRNRGDGIIRVTYNLTLMRDMTYTLDHREDAAAGSVHWTLVESDFFKKNSGSWQLKAVGSAQTDALYDLDVEFKIPVPGFILKKLVQGNLPGMLKSFEERTRKI